MYLDADEDHIQGKQMQAVIERKNFHKIKYLTAENQNLRLLLEDAQKNLEVNKNMIKVIIDH